MGLLPAPDYATSYSMVVFMNRNSMMALVAGACNVPKTPNGIGDMPMTELASKPFKSQVELTPNSEYLFPSSKANAKKPYITKLKTAWAATLLRAKMPYFPL